MLFGKSEMPLGFIGSTTALWIYNFCEKQTISDVFNLKLSIDTFSLHGLVLEIFEVSLYEPSGHRFGFRTQSLVKLQIPRVCDFDFRKIINLR